MIKTIIICYAASTYRPVHCQRVERGFAVTLVGIRVFTNTLVLNPFGVNAHQSVIAKFLTFSRTFLV